MGRQIEGRRLLTLPTMGDFAVFVRHVRVHKGPYGCTGSACCVGFDRGVRVEYMGFIGSPEGRRKVIRAHRVHRCPQVGPQVGPHDAGRGSGGGRFDVWQKRRLD